MTELSCADLGFETEDELINYILDESDILESRNLGYYTREGLLESLHHKDDFGEACLYLGTDNKYFFVWENSEMVHGWSDINLDVDLGVFSSHEEAKNYFDSVKDGERPPIEQILNIKDEIEDPSLWIDAKSSDFTVKYNIKYDYLLVSENVLKISTEKVSFDLDKFRIYLDKLKNRGIEVTELYKLPRKWNDNQRYYIISFEYQGHTISKTAHIASKLQHKERFTPEFFPVDELVSYAEQEYKNQIQSQVIWEEEELEIAERGIPFDYDTAKQLKKYLSDRIQISFSPSKCDGTLRYTKNYLKKKLSHGKDDARYAEKWIVHHGGCCDCEVLMNVMDKKNWPEN